MVARRPTPVSAVASTPPSSFWGLVVLTGRLWQGRCEKHTALIGHTAQRAGRALLANAIITIARMVAAGRAGSALGRDYSGR